MKLPRLGAAAEPIGFQALALGYLIFIYAVFQAGAYPLALLPVAALILIVCIFIPNAFMYLFIISFFWGKYLFAKSLMGVFVFDLIFPFVVLVYFSQYFHRRFSLQNLRIPPMIWAPLFALFGWSVFSFFVNVHSYENEIFVLALWYIGRFVQLLCIMILFGDTLVEFPLPTMTRLVQILFTMQLPIAFYQYSYKANDFFEISRANVYGTLGAHHTMLGTMLLFGICFSLAQLMNDKSRRNVLLQSFFLAVFVFILFISGARSPLVGICLALAIFILMKFRFKQVHFLYISLFAIAVGLLAVFSPLKNIIEFTFASQTTPTTLDYSSVSRLVIWEEALKYYFASDIGTKLYGLGIGAYITIRYSFVLFGGLMYSLGAHNNAIQVLIELGLVGTIIFGVYFFGVLKELYLRMKKDSYAFAYFFLTIALIGSGFTQETFWFQRSMLQIWSFHMIFLVVILRRSTPDRTEKAMAGA